MQSAQIVAMKEYLVTKQMGVSLIAQLLETWLSFVCRNCYQDGDLGNMMVSSTAYYRCHIMLGTPTVQCTPENVYYTVLLFMTIVPYLLSSPLGMAG